MRFWDSSALIPLVLEEATSARMRALLDQDPHVFTSSFARLEIASAIWRRRHSSEISHLEHAAAEKLLEGLTSTWFELPVSHGTLESGALMMSRRPLRAGDALLLGTAVVAAGAAQKPVFVTLDEQQKIAARAEGFPVLP